MKVKNKILTAMVFGTILSGLIIPNKANAALQSNGGTPVGKIGGDWILKIRQMQELGGTLGRTDIVNTTDLSSNATDLDIHMEKNTEYGAMAILSVSAYGNPNKINDGETTTGNSTGIVIKLNGERTAAGLTKMEYNQILNNVKSRYKNSYTDLSNCKIGDAMSETNQWHGSNNNDWYDYNYEFILRGYSNSIFSYNAKNGPNYECIAAYGKKYSSRACIVVGTGL